MHRLSIFLFVTSGLFFFLGFFAPNIALAVVPNCAPNTPGLCITSQTPNPSAPGQIVTISGTAPTPPTGSVWTLYCRFDNNPKIPWDGCGANTSPTGAWTISVSFSTVGTHTVDIALNNQGIAGSYVTATQTVQGTSGGTTVTTTATATTTQTLVVTTTYVTTVSGSLTTVTNTITLTSFSTVTYNPPASTTTYTTIYTSSGQTITSTVTTTVTSGGLASLSTVFFIGGGFLAGLAFTVYIQERKHENVA